MENKKPQQYFESLEGIRGYAFLAVFFIHYNLVTDRPASILRSPAYMALNLGWFLVPIFFVLSGFLITRILLATKNREGFFRVFYLRRAIRVLPLYYTVVGVIVLAGILSHVHFGLKHVAYLVYLQNFTQARISPWIDVSHFWSLAIEEQFYLLWPLAVWFCRSEKSLMRLSYALVAACTLFRIGWPLWHISSMHAYHITPNRVDGILLGCALAVHYNQTKHWDRYVRFAQISIPVTFAALIAVLFIKGSTLPQMNYTGIAFCIPAMNLLGLAFVILALTPGNIVARVCSGKRICSFGQLTYGLYLLHETYSPLFVLKLMPVLARHMGHYTAQFLTSLIALAITIALAWLANRCIELPMASLKDKFKYGPKRNTTPAPNTTDYTEAPQLATT